MANQSFSLLLVRLRGGVKHPQLDRIVAAARGKPAVSYRRGAGRAADDASGGSGGSPRDRVDAEAVCGEYRVVDGIVLELENAYVAVGRSARKQAAGLVRRPRNNVDRCLVQREIVDSLPLVVLCSLFFPEENFAVVAARCEDVAILGVCPGDAPNGAFVSVVQLEGVISGTVS